MNRRQRRDQTTCGHAYVTSDGCCLHCNADLSDELAQAVDALNANIARTLRVPAGQGA